MSERAGVPPGVVAPPYWLTQRTSNRHSDVLGDEAVPAVANAEHEAALSALAPYRPAVDRYGLESATQLRISASNGLEGKTVRRSGDLGLARRPLRARPHGLSGSIRRGGSIFDLPPRSKVGGLLKRARCLRKVAGRTRARR